MSETKPSAEILAGQFFCACGLMFFRAWVLMWLWAWFGAAALGLPPLNWGQCLGLMCLRGFLSGPSPPDSRGVWVAFGDSLANALVSLALGWGIARLLGHA